jgi:hypothetical protein
MKKISILLVILLVAFSIVLAGCKEDVAKQTATKSSSPSASSSGEAQASSSGSAEADVEKASAGSDWADKFSSLAAMKKNLEFSVTYDYSMVDESTNAIESYTMTQYFAKGKYRMDSKIGLNEMSVFMVDNKYTTCNKQDGAWQCFIMPSDEKQDDPTSHFSAIEDNPVDTDTTYEGTKSIAGTTAYCYNVRWSGQGDEGGIEACYSKEGVPLYMKTVSGASEIEMKATKYSTSVSDSDFEPPAEPMDMEAMMAQYR